MITLIKRQFNYRVLILILIFSALFLIPFLRTSSLYSVGGDDTRLYYIFPREMLQNYVMNIVSNNSLGVNAGYGSVSFFLPILLIILSIKTIFPFVNTQLFMHGANLAGGFIFFYLFTGLWVPEKEDEDRCFFSRIVSSLFYILSLFVIKTVFSAQLLAMYTISVFPAVFYLFVKSVKENKLYLSAMAAVAYSLFSPTLLTLPWFGAMTFASIPIVLILVKNYFKTFIQAIFIFIVLVAGLNFYWLFHQMYPLIIRSGDSSVIASVSSVSSKANNINLIQSLSKLNTPNNQLSAYLRSSWSERQNMTFAQSYGILFFLIVLLGGIFVGKMKRQYIRLYILTTAGLLFSFILVTPDFGDWNVTLFIFLNNHIPLFAMFRNMYDKFGIAVSFQFAFALSVSLLIISKVIKKGYLKIFIFIALPIIILWSARGFLFPSKGIEKDFTSISGQFNNDFNNLVTYIKLMHEPSKFLWLPMNFASYVPIEDIRKPGHYYYGASPMQFLAGISDYTGFQSFATTADPDLNFQMLGFLHKAEYTKIGEILQRMNVKYVIVSTFSLPPDAYAHLNFEGAIDEQKDAFYKEILGTKIKDFGLRYSLFRINDKYANDKIFLTHDFQSFGPIKSGIHYKKLYPFQYEISIPNPDGQINLAFLETYNTLWDLSLSDNKGRTVDIGTENQQIIYRYANGWKIDVTALVKKYPGLLQRTDGQAVLRLKLYFRAQQYIYIANLISLVFWVFVAIYLSLILVRMRINERSKK